MTQTTCAVLVSVNKQDGTPDVGATVTAKLSAPDVAAGAGYFGPTTQSQTTNASGQCTLNLWPNVLGAAATFYNITINGAESTIRTTATVPNVGSVSLEAIAATPTGTPKPDGQVAVDAAVAAGTTALGAASQAASSATAAATSASSAATSATNAATNATAAFNNAGVALAAANSAGTASTSASTSASNAASSATAASGSATAAGTSASNASTSATNAANSATAASTSAGNAATSATNAATSTTSATSAANAAAGSSSSAATQATAAATSATNAKTSETNAKTSETNAASSASTASAAAAATTGSVSTAATSATNAANSATAAASSASNSTTSATTASNAATAANASAANAAVSAGQAQTQATAAAGSAASASSTLTAVQAIGAQSNLNAAQQIMLGYATTAQAQASLAASSAASASSVAQQDLSGVTAQALHRSPNPVTALCIYDVSKDSDGGAWVERMGATSWMNEPLNGTWRGPIAGANIAAAETTVRAISGAATGDFFQWSGDGKFYKLNAGTGTTEVFRGNTAKFPKQVGIVAEAANVTLYDLTQPGRPMFARWATGAAFDLHSGSITSLSAVNGVISVGMSTQLITLDHLKDQAALRNASGYYINTNNLSKRNSAGSWQQISNSMLSSATVNAVAMTVLPSAPVDPVTGLQVPTIAVGTAGGVTLLKHDGTAVNSASTAAANKVLLDARDLVWVTSGGALRSGDPANLAASFATGTTYGTTGFPALLGTPTLMAA